MKIIRLISLSPKLDIDVHPDSAMILPGRPFFMPEWGEGWIARVHPAVKIGRLGKNIGRRFASRYYDGFTLAMRVTLSNPDGLDGILSGMDSTFLHGEWLPAETCGHEVKAESGGESINVGPLDDVVADAIAKVSEYMTLKMGDILLLPPVGDPVGLTEGLRTELNVDGVRVAELRAV